MNAAIVGLFCLVTLFLAFRFFGKYLDVRIFKLDAKASVPSHELKDDIDYIPTNKSVLFGHHFASIAGAAPIIGPALAVIWGWVPALLWVLLGTIVWGATHDFGALVLSVRNKGKSIGELAKGIIGSKATTAYMIIIYFVVVLLSAVFYLAIAGILISYPAIVFPVFALMGTAMLIGILIYRTPIGLKPASLVGIIFMLFAIWWGTEHPYPMPEATFIGTDKFTWVTILAIYGFIASILPIWLLLQPRDFLESFQLYAGLILIYLGLFFTAPHFVAPAFRAHIPGAPPILPFLFVTIACGALSGYHSIVSSGTSSKQLNNEKDAKLVGYGGMLAEGSLGILSVLVCTAGFATTALWLKHYASWGHASGLGVKLSAFVDGASGFISHLGIPSDLSQTFVALIIVSFAMTTLDTSCRLGRYIVSEFGDQHKLPVFKNKYVASLMSAGVAYVLAIGLYGGKPAGILLWPLFGTTNQLLASLVFATLTIYLLRKKSPTWPTAIPAVIVTIITLSAMIWNIKEFVIDKNWVLASVGGIILIASSVLIYLSTVTYVKEKRGNRLKEST